ncbi:tRNA (guanine(37)-N1)-methyltransferase-like [Uloborus diversus]|uniref:tRNA (guanine(37)-N1)-methyltransferase-like n=1 Tax=Uloborus diversus TaxID=327109 RepID=UPI0024090C6A|nr:tRNA (guanine(37)-N1)-methyltransferase-like [Uloborus diversus]
MTVLDRAAFQKEVEVPSLVIPLEKLKQVLKVLKPCLLKMCKLPPVRSEGHDRRVLLNPALFDEKLLYLEQVLRNFNLNSVEWTNLQLTYENFSHESIFKVVLPADNCSVSSFSIVGHIIHLNLKPHLMDYKHLIGEVLLDKLHNIKTVVNKAQVIETEFRNFQMELLAGEPNYEVTVKENGFQYAFDFSKVFWNPRLVHEHGELVKKIDSGATVFDVFAGVGPFAIPLAKKKCVVHANDLNPDSYQWLCHNAELNKVKHNLTAYNLDGRDFIQSIVKEGLLRCFKSPESPSIHIIMNLPACALSFVDTFCGLLKSSDFENHTTPLVFVHCYFFLKKDEDEAEVAEKYLDLESQTSMQICPVRVVAPNKRMMRITYKLSPRLLFSLKEDFPEPSAKRIKT